MKQEKLQHQKCCGKQPKYLITYSCGPEPDQTLLVCEDHYKEEPFHKFIKDKDIL